MWSLDMYRTRQRICMCAGFLVSADSLEEEGPHAKQFKSLLNRLAARWDEPPGKDVCKPYAECSALHAPYAPQPSLTKARPLPNPTQKQDSQKVGIFC